MQTFLATVVAKLVELFVFFLSKLIKQAIQEKQEGDEIDKKVEGAFQNEDKKQNANDLNNLFN